MRAVVAVASGKGGVGKTALVANVAATLAADGLRVLAVDLDDSGDLGIDLRYRRTDADDEGAALARALSVGPATAPRLARDVCPGLDVLPGGKHLRFLASLSGHLKGDAAHALTWTLAHFTEDYDLILLDCPGRVGPMTLLALSAADAAVIPVRADDASFAALDVLAGQWRQVLGAPNPCLALLGVALTQVPPAADDLLRGARADLTEMGGDTPLPVFAATIRSSPSVAYHSRRHGITTADHEHTTLPATDDDARTAHSLTSDLAEDYSGLACDYLQLADEILQRLQALQPSIPLHRS